MGAETPWEEASAVLRKHLAPDMVEEDSGAYLAASYKTFADMQFEHSVPGVMDFGVVDLTP